MKTFLTGVFLIIIVIAGYAVFNRPHEFTVEDCKGCHIGTPQPGQKSPLPMIGKIKILCSRCHSNVVRGYSHPDDVAPVNARVPADMPLSVDSKISCATCHDIHSVAEWSKSVQLLRRPVSGIEFCGTCHEDKPGEPSHSSAVPYAHGAGARYIPTGSAGSLDRLSIQCLSCHDSSIGKGDSLAGAGYWTHSKDLAKHLGGHPIGVSYAEAKMKDHKGYKEKSSLPPVKLFGGTVGCGSCHDPYTTRKNKLVMDNQGSKLCYKCHDR